MILTSHIIAGGILAQSNTNYFLAAVIGLLSHYILDTIPHWEYSIQEYKNLSQTHDLHPLRKEFLIDSIKIVLDAAFGFLFLILFIYRLKAGHFLPSIIGGFFGIIPDLLQFIYWIFPIPILKAHYDFHFAIHNKFKPTPAVGILTQVMTVAAVAYLFLR